MECEGWGLGVRVGSRGRCSHASYLVRVSNVEWLSRLSHVTDDAASEGHSDLVVALRHLDGGAVVDVEQLAHQTLAAVALLDQEERAAVGVEEDADVLQDLVAQ